MRLASIRRSLQRPLVRPWALTGPVVILMLCLPLLRPLRQPDPTRWSDEEQMIAATVQAIVEQHSLAIDKTVFASNPIAVSHGGQLYSPYPPMYAVTLAPFYWVMMKQRLLFADNLIFVQYLLTILGATVPVALCAGLIYRLARMFELRRSLRVSVGLAAVIGGGLISYGVVPNRHAPAAMLLLIALSCMSNLAVAGHPWRHWPVMIMGGFSAALAAMIDPPATVLAILLITPLLAMRWSAALRFESIVLFLVGAAPVIALNCLLLHSAGMPLSNMLMVKEPAIRAPASPITVTAHANFQEFEDDSDLQPSVVQIVWGRIADLLGRLLEGLVGEHGALSHFPVLILGVIGAFWVLHRNWTPATKCMAAVTLISSLLLLIAYALGQRPKAMTFGAPWFVATSPVLAFWAGAWLRKSHRGQSWAMAGIALGFSVLVALVGMSDPTPRDAYKGYSFPAAALDLVGRSQKTANHDLSPNSR